MRVRTVRDLAVASRGRRMSMGLSQEELAHQAGVSRKWVSDFETGKPTIALDPLLAVLDVLGLALEVSVPTGTALPPRVDLDELLGEYRRDP